MVALWFQVNREQKTALLVGYASQPVGHEDRQNIASWEETFGPSSRYEVEFKSDVRFALPWAKGDGSYDQAWQNWVLNTRTSSFNAMPPHWISWPTSELKLLSMVKRDLPPL